jgi:hypothetical protein
VKFCEIHILVEISPFNIASNCTGALHAALRTHAVRMAAALSENNARFHQLSWEEASIPIGREVDIPFGG